MKNKVNLLAAAIMTVFTYVVLICVFLAAFNLIGPDVNHPMTSPDAAAVLLPAPPVSHS